MSFNTNTGTLSGTPTNSDVGSHNVVLTATDSSGAVTSQSFTITVYNTNDAPTVANAIADQSTAEDASFSYQVLSNIFADVDSGTTLAYTATLSNGSSLPSWLSFNTSTKTFSGTPSNSEVGTIAVKVTASDGSASVSDTFNITVTNVNDPPSINPKKADNAIQGTSYSKTFTATDIDVGDGATLSYVANPDYSGSSYSHASWLSYNALNASSGVLSGTPSASDVGTQMFSLKAIDTTGHEVTTTYLIFLLFPSSKA